MRTALGLEPKTVRLVLHDPRWATLYEDEARRLRLNIGPMLIAIGHMGSTAVPGLMAKPIIDILLGVASLEEPQPLVDALRMLGYAHGVADDIDGRLYFRLDDAAGQRTHQLSACVHGGSFWNAHLHLRDALRQGTSLAAEYERLKLTLAARLPRDCVAYGKAKDDFVARVLGR